jgi:hypothetical protein
MRLVDGGCVAHVVDGADPQALQGLARTARVLDGEAVEQVVVEMDQAPGISRAGRVRALEAGLARLAGAGGLHAVHLHGWEACLLGPLALKALDPRVVRVLCSPHRRQPAVPWAWALAGRMLRARLAPFDHAPLATSLAEAEALGRVLQRSVELLPPVVAECFLDAPRREDARPRVLAQGRGAPAVDIVARLSVLLNGREPRVRFCWMGPAAARERGQLEAASVEVLEPADESGAARALACAWLAIAPSREPGPALALAQAMAAGVPCLVSAAPEHRALVRHGETGFVCASERDFLEHTVFLLRDAAERRRLGEAARADAGRRFTEAHFRRALLRAYGLPGARTRVAEVVIENAMRNACTASKATALDGR